MPTLCASTISIRDVLSVRGQPSRTLLVALMAACVFSCRSNDKNETTAGESTAPVASPSASSGAATAAAAPTTTATTGVSPGATTTATTGVSPGASASPADEDHSTHDCTLHSEPRPPPPPGATATVLDRADLGKLTTIRVSAHVGGVVIRKRGQDWVLSGKRGCTLPAERVRRALENLASLESTPRDGSLPVGSPYELQIDVLINETHAIHFEIAPAPGEGDIVRLMDDSTHVLYGLDHDLWAPQPSAWCQGL